MPLAGGIMQHGYQCGMIWGAALAAGAEAYHRFGAGPKAQAAAIAASQRVVTAFKEQNKHINCEEITHIDRSSSTWQMISFFLLKGGTIGCFKMAARFAPLAYQEINAALSDVNGQTAELPVSCTALLAEKMGASEMQTVMAAGLAGGIGLCGGACGALGAAIWMQGITNGADQKVNMDFSNPPAMATIEIFLAASEYEFECADIVSRQFENTADHAAYIRQGGCGKIFDALVAG